MVRGSTVQWNTHKTDFFLLNYSKSIKYIANKFEIVILDETNKILQKLAIYVWKVFKIDMYIQGYIWIIL